MHRKPDIRNFFSNLKKSSRFHNVMVFLGFVVVATVFWFMMAMNDSIQKDCTVRLQIDNVPDTVTFIKEPPSTMHVSVRDKGTNLLRSVGFRQPTMHINFNDYAYAGRFRFTASDMKASLKALFGKGASVLAVSLDSIGIDYSVGKGRQVPVVAVGTFEAAPGSVVMGKPISSPSRVRVFGPREILDTVTRIFTRPVVRKNIKETVVMGVDLNLPPHVRVIPERVEVTVKAEPLVRREETVEINTINVPQGVNLILFPSSVTVSYYVPMSKFGDDVPPMGVFVDYVTLAKSTNGKLGVELVPVKGAVNPSLSIDSVEYSVVR